MSKERYSPTLLSEAKKLGYDASDLDKYYNKGLFAWTQHKIPGVTPEQLAVAVVEEFVSAEKTKKYTIREELKPDPVIEPGLKKPSLVVERKVHYVEVKANDDVVQEWINESREKYIKRYGEALAEQKLAEAAKVFVEAKSSVGKIYNEGKWAPPEEPSHPNKAGTKRHSWDMANWHERKRQEAETSGNAEAAKHHASKIKEYKNKVMTPSWDQKS